MAQEANHEPRRPSGPQAAFEWGLVVSRAVVVVPVVVLVLLALAAFAYGVAVFVDGVGEVVAHPFPVGDRIGLFLLIIDLFLIGATMLIAAIGFYELFIGRVRAGRARRLPGWLVMNDLNDLKARVVAMIVLVAAVSFVEVLVDQGGGLGVLEVGGGVALVIVALTVFLRQGGHGGGEA